MIEQHRHKSHKSHMVAPKQEHKKMIVFHPLLAHLRHMNPTVYISFTRSFIHTILSIPMAFPPAALWCLLQCLLGNAFVTCSQRVSKSFPFLLHCNSTIRYHYNNFKADYYDVTSRNIAVYPRKRYTIGRFFLIPCTPNFMWGLYIAEAQSINDYCINLPQISITVHVHRN